MYRLMIACVLALLAALAGTAMTKTPDKQPPSTETSCVGLTGAARGLCNAYCQAQDCDVHQRPSCEVLRKNFQRATGSSKFPCDRVACGQSAPQCNGDCPAGFACTSGAEAGGPEGGGRTAAVPEPHQAAHATRQAVQLLLGGAVNVGKGEAVGRRQVLA